MAKHYVESWFFLDVASGIPFALIDLLVSDAPGDAPLLKMVKSLWLLRFIKLTRLFKLNSMTSAVS